MGLKVCVGVVSVIDVVKQEGGFVPEHIVKRQEEPVGVIAELLGRDWE